METVRALFHETSCFDLSTLLRRLKMTIVVLPCWSVGILVRNAQPSIVKHLTRFRLSNPSLYCTYPITLTFLLKFPMQLRCNVRSSPGSPF